MTWREKGEAVGRWIGRKVQIGVDAAIAAFVFVTFAEWLGLEIIVRAM